MKKRTSNCFSIIYITYYNNIQTKSIISKFNLKKIIIENNFLLKKDIRKLLKPIYDKNLIFLESKEIEKIIKTK